MKYVVLVVLLCPAVVFAQTIMPVVQGEGLKTLFIDEKGKEVFRLSEGYKPLTKHPENIVGSSWSDHQSLDIFSSGICPVSTANGFIFWINTQGQIVANFKKQYAQMGPFQEGYCLVWEKIEGRSAYWLIYLDAAGKNAFGRKYWEAKPFSEGLAAVQPDEKGPWGFIDSTGVMTVFLDTAMQGEMALLGSFHNGLAKVLMRGKKVSAYSYQYRYYFVDRRGRVALDLEKIFPGTEIESVSDFSEGRAQIKLKALDTRQKQSVWIDTLGMRVFYAQHVSGYVAFHHGLAALNIEEPLGQRVYRSGTELVDLYGHASMPPVDTALYALNNTRHILDEYYVIDGVDKQKEHFATLIFSRKDHSLVVSTPAKVQAYYKDFILLKHEDSEEFELMRLPGTVLWKSPVESLRFSTIQDALKVKDRVHRYDAYDKDFSKDVYQLKNLESLKISYNDMMVFPEGIEKLQNLKKLDLNNLTRLNALPEGITKLSKLEELHISQCGRIINLERIVENLPALRKLSLFNKRLSPGFIDRMKKTRPSLKIENLSWLDL